MSSKLHWITDEFGYSERQLNLGGICVGSVDNPGRSHTLIGDPWRVWLNIDPDGKLIGRFKTEEEAKKFLFDAAVKALNE